MDDQPYSAKDMRRIFGCKKGPKHYNNETDDCKLGYLGGLFWIEESKYTHNPESLTHYDYADRMGNDSEASGDGDKYRGRGMVKFQVKMDTNISRESIMKITPKTLKTL